MKQYQLQYLDGRQSWLVLFIFHNRVADWIQAVPPSSAAPPFWANMEPLAMHADHPNMVKFASKENPGYRTISANLLTMADKAPGAISARWENHNMELHGYYDGVRTMQAISGLGISPGSRQASGG